MKDIYVMKVIDEYNVVLNVGSNDGISYHQKFMIYAIDKEEIIDPVTGENLGCAEYSKGCGEVTSVQEKLCTITSTKVETATRREKVGSYSPFSPLINDPLKVVEYHEKIKAPFDNPQKGDRAKII